MYSVRSPPEISLLAKIYVYRRSFLKQRLDRRVSGEYPSFGLLRAHTHQRIPHRQLREIPDLDLPRIQRLHLDKDPTALHPTGILDAPPTEARPAFESHDRMR